MAALNEKCAVVAIVGADSRLPAAVLAHDTLIAMQHRGPEASGIATQQSDGSLEYHRGRGLVRDVYSDDDMRRLTGSVAVGHNRYSTNGSRTDHPQPAVDKDVGSASAHNGNLSEAEYLSTFLAKHNFVTNGKLNDSEMMGLAIAQYIRSGQDLPSAVELAYPLFRGAFSCVTMHDGLIAAFRDPKGIRPLALGELSNGQGFAVTSETCGLDTIGAQYIREVEPGEMIIVTKGGVESKRIADGDSKLDMFELVYFARPDSMLYGMPVGEFRYQCGQQLADLHPPITDNLSNVLVVPVPDTSVPAAEGYAERLGLQHRQAIVKNRYIGRTFMSPSDTARQEQLRRKHNFVPESVKGRDVVLIDDSIVRLNTVPRLVALANAEGAKSVSVLIASPPVRFPDYYGIDTPSQTELAAANMTIERMREEIGCQYLGFLSLSRLVAASGMPASKFNLSPFNGEYPIGIGHHKSEIRMPVSMEFAD